MADVAVENKETPVVEKEVDESEAVPKVAEDDVVETTTPTTTTTENGSVEVVEEDKPAENGKETEKTEEAAANGEEETTEETDAPSEAVKRKVTDAPATEAVSTDDVPEKKAKLDEKASSEAEANGAEAEAVA